MDSNTNPNDTNKPLKLEPTLIMWLTVLFIVVTTSMALYVSTQQPWIGVTFSERVTTTQGLEVLGIAKGSPAEGKLKVGDRVIAIQGNSEPVNIDYKFLIDPTTLPNLKQYDHFFVQQQAAHNILLQNEIKLILADGSERIIAPRY